LIFAGVIEFIERHDRFLLTAHESPDGDALGSEYAMARAMRQLGKEVLVCNADPVSETWRFIDDEGLLLHIESADQLPGDLSEWALFILDTNDTSNIGRIAELVLPFVAEYFIIDHHDYEEDLLAPNLIQRGASSTAEIVYQLLEVLGVEIDQSMAQAMFAAIVFDTGSFVYPKTTAITFEIARALVERGVVPNQVYSLVHESKSVSSLLLQARVLGSLELIFDNRVAIQTMSKEILAESGASYDEADQIINTPLSGEAVRVSVFFKQNEEGQYRCSMRSKGEVNCASVAQEFGGGGHRTAAGFRVSDGYENARHKLLQRLEEALAAGPGDDQ
jgi:phosphoesterase RecJ-like protein